MPVPSTGLPQIFRLILLEIYATQGNAKGAIQEVEEFLRRHPDSSYADGVKNRIRQWRSEATSSP